MMDVGSGPSQASMPLVEEGDVVLIDLSKPPGAPDAAWVPAQVAHVMQQRIDELLAEIEAIKQRVQRAIFGGRFRGDGAEGEEAPGGGKG